MSDVSRTDALTWQNRLFPGKTVTDCALALRSAINGGSDPMSREDVKEARDMLVRRLVCWSPNVWEGRYPTGTIRGSDCEIDAAAKQLVEAAVRMADAYLAESPV